MVSAAQRAGGEARWGLRHGDEDDVLVLPAPYLATVFDAVAECTRGIMATVDLDLLTPHRADDFDHDFWLPGRRFASNALLLSGLSDGARCPDEGDLRRRRRPLSAGRLATARQPRARGVKREARRRPR